MNETVTIKHITYNVIRRQTADDLEAQGMPNRAASYRKHGHVAEYLLQKPNGKVIYSAVQYQSGSFSNLVNMGA